MKHATLTLRILSAGALLAGMAGCSHVEPYQRGTLSEPIMRTDRDPIAKSVAEHVYFTREASFGGGGVGGGGCGCN